MNSCTTGKILNSEIASYRIEKSDLDEIKNKVIFTTDLNSNKRPVNNKTIFSLQSDKKIIIFIQWFNLKKDKYCIQFDWIDSYNQLFHQCTGAFKPTNYSWHTWDTIFMDSEVLIPIGKGKVNVYLNNALYGSYDLEIKKDEVNKNINLK